MGRDGQFFWQHGWTEVVVICPGMKGTSRSQPRRQPQRGGSCGGGMGARGHLLRDRSPTARSCSGSLDDESLARSRQLGDFGSHANGTGDLGDLSSLSLSSRSSHQAPNGNHHLFAWTSKKHVGGNFWNSTTYGIKVQAKYMEGSNLQPRGGPKNGIMYRNLGPLLFLLLFPLFSPAGMDITICPRK